MNRENEKITGQSQMFANRLQKRFRHLKKWAQRKGVGAFRLYDRDIPEIPLVLDFYGNCTLPWEAAIAGALYKRPYEKSEEDENQWLSVMKDTIALALGIAPDHIFLKQRQRQRGASQYEKTGEARFEKIVSEGDLSFKVNLSDYLDTGLFPDRRLLRAMVRSEASGKKVLNLFSYTGSFSVYAAAGGAASTDSVDLSNTYLSWARENFSLNGFSAQLLQVWDFFSGNASQGAHRLIRADVLDFLEKAAVSKNRWDIIVLDPPVFSNSKKMTGNFDLQRDFIDLAGKCLKLLAGGGKLFISVNQRQFKTSAAEIGEKLEVYVTDLQDKVTDEDFHGKKIPQSFLINEKCCCL
ncbi:MAG: class I SAM-dependent methyltransferase [Treponema sp.]|jgi:23S rRNA G2069 N7-methylase RlmK/C1962 C5-methylase RlmI|nr:class I SAM-dependent methyltransferase [Treponema sp.]